MARKTKFLAVSGAFLCLLWFSACGNATPTATPTTDLNPFRTEVAATVFAQVTRDLALTPSPTQIPSPTSTNTQTVTPTQAANPSPGAVATLPGSTPGTPLATTGNDLAQWVSQTIADGTIFAPGEAFTITWRLKNVGASTWSVSYMLRFYSGEAFGAPPEVLLGRTVLPGEMVDISVPMKAPTRPGDYRSDWVMSTDNRSNFKEPVFLKITVVNPPTPTPTPTSTPAPTTTP